MISAKDFDAKQLVFVFPASGDSISFRNDNILVRDKEGKTKIQTTCYLLFVLFIVGNMSLTSSILDRSKKFGFSIVFMSINFRVLSILNNGAEGNVLLRKIQYEYNGFEIGSRIIQNKIENQKQCLASIRRKDPFIKEAITQMGELSKQVRQPGLNCHEIMGFEGVASKKYFSQVFKDYCWTSRKPRAKHDMTNCLLDIGYTLLFSLMDSLLSLFGFDTYKGVLHREFFQRKSLVCDLVEPFRPIIDFSIRKAYNLGQIHEKDFYFSQNQYCLFGKQAIPYMKLLLNPLLERKNDLFLYVQKYYRVFIGRKEIDCFPWFSFQEGK